MENNSFNGYAFYDNSSHRATLDVISEKGPLSRAGVARELNISRPSSSRVVNKLLDARLLVEGKRISSKAGRRQTLLDINPAAAVVAGLSVRSNHIRLALSDLKGQELAYTEENTNRGSAEAIVEQIADLIARAMAPYTAPLASIAVGISGAWDQTRREVWATPNLPVLDGSDLLALLEAKLGESVLLRTVAVDNDINYAALGEMAHGAAQGEKTFFYLNVGSGIGGGVVVDGRIHAGYEGFAGEVGRLPVYFEGRYRALEDVASRRQIAEHARGLGMGESASDLLDLARAGDERALGVVEAISEHLAVGCAAVVTVMNAELIVLGGSVGRYSDVLIPHIEEKLSQITPTHPPIVGTQLGANAAVTGALVQALQLARDRVVHVALT